MKALIIGESGQDGTLLRQQLRLANVETLGLVRADAGTSGDDRLAVDIEDQMQLARVVASFGPEQIYFLAAYHHSSQQPIADEAVHRSRSWAVNTHAFENVLSVACEQARPPSVFYASSSRIFSGTQEGLKDEQSLRAPVCLYGLTKMVGMQVADYYRRSRGLRVGCGILFNHESRHRKPHFLSRRVIDGLVAIRRGEADVLEIGSLEAAADWGFAPDYVHAMQLILDQSCPGDYIVASGQAHSVGEMISIAAGLLGLRWQDCVVENGSVLQRSTATLVGDANRLIQETGWRPTVDFPGLVKVLLDAALTREPARPQ